MADEERGGQRSELSHGRRVEAVADDQVHAGQRPLHLDVNSHRHSLGHGDGAPAAGVSDAELNAAATHRRLPSPADHNRHVIRLAPQLSREDASDLLPGTKLSAADVRHVHADLVTTI
jgi:hypothetical protein